MSIESAKSFLEKLKTDEEFAGKVSACRDAQARMLFAATAGFQFTPEEMKEASAMLAEDDLATISGGNGSHPGNCSGYTPPGSNHPIYNQ